MHQKGKSLVEHTQTWPILQKRMDECTSVAAWQGARQSSAVESCRQMARFTLEGVFRHSFRRHAFCIP